MKLERGRPMGLGRNEFCGDTGPGKGERERERERPTQKIKRRNRERDAWGKRERWRPRHRDLQKRHQGQALYFIKDAKISP